ncbi:MAG: hypothetical protein Q8P30_01030 [Candidatus Uhrbacteria bacterium]|nr:hypothetical protein [Candidatus Uhrbacteria bacterium]
MKSLQEGLIGLGLVSGQARAEHAVKSMEEDDALSARNGRAGASALSLIDCKNVREFRHVAKRLLLRRSAGIRELITTAYELPDDASRKRLIWQLQQVSRGLMMIDEEKRDQFLNRALRGSNPMFNTDF